MALVGAAAAIVADGLLLLAVAAGMPSISSAQAQGQGQEQQSQPPNTAGQTDTTMVAAQEEKC